MENKTIIEMMEEYNKNLQTLLTLIQEVDKQNKQIIKNLKGEQN